MSFKRPAMMETGVESEEAEGVAETDAVSILRDKD